MCNCFHCPRVCVLLNLSLCITPCVLLPVYFSLCNLYFLCISPCVFLLVYFSLSISPCVSLPVHLSLCISPCVSVLLNFSCVRPSSQRRGPRAIISSRRDPTTNYTMRTTLISAKCVADTKEKKSGVIFDICQKMLKHNFCPFPLHISMCET